MEQIQQTQTEQLEQLQEPTLTDGQTDNLPPPPIEEQNPTQNQPTESESGVGEKKLPEYYTQDEFFEVFKSVFDYAGKLTGTESLPIKQNELAGARITSDRLYETAKKYAFMRPLISRNTSRVVETILMIQFIGGKASSVYKEKTSLNLGGVLWKKAKKALGLKQKVAIATDSLAQAGAEKQQKPANSSETPAG